MKTKRILWRILPYGLSILSGSLFLYTGFRVNPDLKGLFISIAAAFFAIPLVYLFYQQAHNFSQKRLNKEIFDYAKMQIDTDILSIVNQLRKLVYPVGETGLSESVTNKFLSNKIDNINEIISGNEYLGFQVFKKWEISENNLHSTLENSFMHRSLENEHLISIISIIKSLRYLENFQNVNELYVPLENKEITSYKVISGRELNAENTQFPERRILMKDLGDNKGLVVDFGDFKTYNIDNLLKVFVLNKEYVAAYSVAISELIQEINAWLDLTGREFILDSQMFRVGYRRKINQ